MVVSKYFEPLQNWVVPGVTKTASSGLIIGCDHRNETYALISFSPELTRAVAIFDDRDRALRAVRVINEVLNAPAASRMGGKDARSGMGSKHPGVEWVALDVKNDEDGRQVPDTAKPLSRLWVLPHRQLETIALMEVDGPDGHQALCAFSDDDAANEFIETMDILFNYVSTRVQKPGNAN